MTRDRYLVMVSIRYSTLAQQKDTECLHRPSTTNGRMGLTPWTARLIEQLNHQLEGVSETIQAAQSELAEATLITIDEALLDLFPVLFAALETFKYSYANWMVRPTQGADAMIQLAASPSCRSDSSPSTIRYGGA